MAWKIFAGRRYYYRSKRIDGRVVTEYVGGGSSGKKAAAADRRRRQQLEQQHASLQARKADYTECIAAAAQACDSLKHLMNAALVASGFYRNDNSEWRIRYGTVGSRGKKA